MSSITMFVIFFADFSIEESGQICASSLQRTGARLVTVPAYDELCIPNWFDHHKALILLDQYNVTPRLLVENLSRSELQTLAFFNIIPNLTHGMT